MSETESTTLAVVRKIQDIWRAGKSDSLIDYTASTRVEPVVLIGSDLIYSDLMPLVAQATLSMIAGYYMQGIAVSMTVGKIEVERTLSKLNPHRNAADAAVDSAGWLLSVENYKDCLPTPVKKVALESIADRMKDQADSTTFATGRDTNREIKELSNLAVGKLLSVDIGDGLHRATIPVSVRLRTSSLPTERLANILALGTEDNSMKERYYRWKADDLTSIKDMIFCQDLIDAHYKNLIADKDGAYSTILSRNRENQVASLVSLNPSVATASNVVVISAETAKEVERLCNGKLESPSTRQRLFKGKTIMILVVVDTYHDMVTFYHRNIPHATEVGRRGLEEANRSGGPNVSDVLKAYQLGNNPTL